MEPFLLFLIQICVIINHRNKLEEIEMGLRISIYRASYNSDLNYFKYVKELTLVNVNGPSEPTKDAPAAKLIYNYQETAVIVPENVDGTFAFGGSFGATSDSRFRESVENITGSSFYGAVPIHDRQMNKEK